MRFAPGFITLAAAAIFLAPASGQTGGASGTQPRRIDQSARGGTREFFVTFQWFTAPQLEVNDVFIPNVGTNDAILQIDDKDIYGLGFGMNIDEHWTVWGDLSYGSPRWEAKWGDQLLQGRGDLWMGRINADYNLLDRALTPFVTGGVGFTYFNSRVPSGRTDVDCWWDYWWGYVCSGSTPTHDKWSFSPNAGAGLRWDVNDMFFVKGAVNWNWVDIGESGYTAFTQYTVNVGWGW